MAKGRIISIEQRTIGVNLDQGIIQDINSGKEHYFEAKRGSFSLGETVEYKIASVPADVGRKGPDGNLLVKLIRK